MPLKDFLIAKNDGYTLDFRFVQQVPVSACSWSISRHKSSTKIPAINDYIETSETSLSK